MSLKKLSSTLSKRAMIMSLVSSLVLTISQRLKHVSILSEPALPPRENNYLGAAIPKLTSVRICIN